MHDRQITIYDTTTLNSICVFITSSPDLGKGREVLQAYNVTLDSGILGKQ